MRDLIGLYRKHEETGYFLVLFNLLILLMTFLVGHALTWNVLQLLELVGFMGLISALIILIGQDYEQAKQEGHSETWGTGY